MKTVATLAAIAAVLGLGLAGTASATAPLAATGDEIGPQVSTESSVADAGYSWYYRQGWRGNCFYKYLYVTDGYRWAYRWRRTCY